MASLLAGRPVLVAACVPLVAMVLVVVTAPWLPLVDPNRMDVASRLKPPGTPGYPLGTDGLGRDVLSRLIWGGRISLLAGFLPLLAVNAVGIPVGLVAGHFGGKTDGAVMRLVEIGLAFPSLLLAIALLAALGPSLRNAIIAIAISAVPAKIRFVRGQTLQLERMPYVDAARTLGYGHVRIMFGELLPNVVPLIVTLTALQATGFILATAALSFLGLGTQPPQADWGTMVADGMTLLSRAPHVLLMPSLALTVVALCLNAMADELQAVLNPRAGGSPT